MPGASLDTPQQNRGKFQVHRIGEHVRHPLDDSRQRQERRQCFAEATDRDLIAEPGAIEGAVDDVLGGAAQRVEHIGEQEDEPETEDCVLPRERRAQTDGQGDEKSVGADDGEGQ